MNDASRAIAAEWRALPSSPPGRYVASAPGLVRACCAVFGIDPDGAPDGGRVTISVQGLPHPNVMISRWCTHSYPPNVSVVTISGYGGRIRISASATDGNHLSRTLPSPDFIGEFLQAASVVWRKMEPT